MSAAPTSQPTPLRRLLDTTQQSLTINYAQVRDAVERVFRCTPPKIVNGLWAVFQDQAREAAELQAAQQTAQQAARERAARQSMLETAFGPDVQARSPSPLDAQLLSTLDALDTNEHMASRLRASLDMVRTTAGEQTLAQIELRITELRHRATELRALGATA